VYWVVSPPRRGGASGAAAAGGLGREMEAAGVFKRVMSRLDWSPRRIQWRLRGLALIKDEEMGRTREENRWPSASSGVGSCFSFG
jgi:hypothetical protein